MSQFIKNDNQSLLWNTIQQTAHFKTSNSSDAIKVQLFKQIMKQFYEQIKIKRPHQKLSRLELENYNKQTIQTFLGQLQKHDMTMFTPSRTVNARGNVTLPYVPSESPPEGGDLNRQRYKEFNNSPDSGDIFRAPGGPYAAAESTKHVTFQIAENGVPPMSFRPVQPIGTKENPMDAFTQRQREYETMVKRDVPVEPNFKLQIEDTVIENMDELLEAQIRQRELDLQQINPTGSLVSPPNKPIKPIAKPASHAFKIQEDAENIAMEVLPLQNDISTPTWFKEFADSLREMKEEMSQLTTEIRTIYKKFVEKMPENLNENEENG